MVVGQANCADLIDLMWTLKSCEAEVPLNKQPARINSLCAYNYGIYKLWAVNMLLRGGELVVTCGCVNVMAKSYDVSCSTICPQKR